MNQKHVLRKKRHQHIRKAVSGSEIKPRLCVYRSNAHIYAQIIDDVNQRTVAEASDMKLEKGSMQEKAKEVGLNIAKLAKKVNIETVVFDRAGYKFHGRVKALAEGAREGGLVF